MLPVLIQEFARGEHYPYTAPSILPLLKPPCSFFPGGGIEYPLTRGDDTLFKGPGTVKGDIPYLVHHTPLNPHTGINILNSRKKSSTALRILPTLWRLGHGFDLSKGIGLWGHAVQGRLCRAWWFVFNRFLS